MRDALLKENTPLSYVKRRGGEKSMERFLSRQPGSYNLLGLRPALTLLSSCPSLGFQLPLDQYESSYEY
ncbi:MAG: hypothetical protein B7Y25_05625 [Alphaproteobacteria bacterium 16-39-46]|nr:MAG: hypothetical protein B7Y25_05625 [Alphaproteobacteria bacterium 16-39-46]OZA42577.1 MAG: hypothetical protein B7X84_05525 [Alphaproteobacteria bacterium 17-39-52]